MTAPARIPLAEIQRAVKAAKAVGGAGARVIVDLARQRLEIVLNTSPDDPDGFNPWDQDDA